MDESFKKGPTGNWVAPLPFKTPRNRLPDNREIARKRAFGLQKNLHRDYKKREHFVAFMQSTFDKGHAEVAPPLANSEESWYLPWFGVYHTKKHKVRVMFDSSASHNGVSLNSVLMAGPVLTNSLVGILLTFRRDAIAVITDIKQMFYAFHAEQDHRNFLRFLWHKDNDLSKELIEFRMCVHVFGNKPSPAVATYGPRKSIQTQELSVQEFVHRNFYVDDGLASFSMPEEAIDVMNKEEQEECLEIWWESQTTQNCVK